MESDLRYPIGKFEAVTSLTPDQRRQYIDVIADAPARLAAAVAGLTPAQLDTPYRPEGWTVRQLVHHIADSHMNAVIRFKLTLTEDEPMVKTYEESLWAELADAKTPPIETSLVLIDNLHNRWVLLLRSIAPAEWLRKFRHPQWGPATMDFLLAQYAWHSKHHVAHITALRQRHGW
ncbi:MAG: putative metal-dependent hydrolase [Candidatus Acidiferrales bacterium]